jgi:hypothetical protein
MSEEVTEIKSTMSWWIKQYEEATMEKNRCLADLKEMESEVSVLQSELNALKYKLTHMQKENLALVNRYQTSQFTEKDEYGF